MLPPRAVPPNNPNKRTPPPPPPPPCPGLPLLNKRVYQTEQQMAHLRDTQYDSMDAKSHARDSRLRAGVKLPGSSAPGSSSGGDSSSS